MKFIDLQTQYQHLKGRIDKRIQTVLDHGKYIMGPEVAELEEKLAEYVGVKHAISCANGTDALQLSLLALGIGPGDAVFCPTFTYFATAEVIAICGATPIFVDSDERTYNICPQDLQKRIEQTISSGVLELKAIIAVDLFGLPANYPALEKISKTYDLTLIEDAAQGFGGEINGKRAGNFGDIATTSFYPAKPLGCYGDGGAIFTNNDELAMLLKSLRVHGRGDDKYDNVRIGMNSRLDTIQAAILLEKLAVFPYELVERRRIAEQYSARIERNVEIPWEPDGFVSSWAQYTPKSNNRDLFMEKLLDCGIPTMVYYKTCMHQQVAFRCKGRSRGVFPTAELLSESVFSLPMHPYQDEQAILKVTATLAPT